MRAFAELLVAAPDRAARAQLKRAEAIAAGARIELVPFDTIEALPGGGR